MVGRVLGGRATVRPVGHKLATRSGCRVVYTDTGSNFGIPDEAEPYYLPKAWNETDLPRTLTDHPAWKALSGGLGGAFTERMPLLCRLLAMLSIVAMPEEAEAAARTCLSVSEIASLLEQAAQRTDRNSGEPGPFLHWCALPSTRICSSNSRLTWLPTSASSPKNCC